MVTKDFGRGEVTQMLLFNTLDEALALCAEFKSYLTNVKVRVYEIEEAVYEL